VIISVTRVIGQVTGKARLAHAIEPVRGESHQPVQNGIVFIARTKPGWFTGHGLNVDGGMSTN